MIKFLVLCCFMAVAMSSPLTHGYPQASLYYREFKQQGLELPHQDQEEVYFYPDEDYVVARPRRSLQPGAPGFPMPNQQPPTSITPHITKQDGTTNVGAVISHKTPNAEVTGHWEKNIRGPGRSKPNWSVRGTYRW